MNLFSNFNLFSQLVLCKKDLFLSIVHFKVFFLFSIFIFFTLSWGLLNAGSLGAFGSILLRHEDSQELAAALEVDQMNYATLFVFHDVMTFLAETKQPRELLDRKVAVFHFFQCFEKLTNQTIVQRPITLKLFFNLIQKCQSRIEISTTHGQEL